MLSPSNWTGAKQSIAAPCQTTSGNTSKYGATSPPSLLRLMMPGPCVGLGIIAGTVSGGIKCLDFDNKSNLPEADIFEKWTKRIDPDLYARLVVYQTPGNGWRVVYKSRTVHRTPRLVWARMVIDGKPHCLLEILTEGSVVVVPGGHPAAHQSGKPYIYVQGHLDNVPILDDWEHFELLSAANCFNTAPPLAFERKCAKAAVAKPVLANPNAIRPGDDFDARANWEEILCPAGWTYYRGSGGGCGYWARLR